MQFEQVMARRGNRLLRAMAKLYHFRFSNRRSTADERQRLCAFLLSDNRLRRMFKRLSPEAHAALRAAQATPMTLPEFCRVFGAIRPYRPWDKSTPRHMWRHPISTAEQLWFLGMIEIVAGHPPRVVVPAEVLALLPALPRPHAEPPQPADGVLLVDLAIWLGTLMRGEREAEQGWLSPRRLREVNQRLWLPDAEVPRSELKSERLKFLHYLAEVTGLTTRKLRPTVKAWRFLALPPQEQWAVLLKAWLSDLKHKTPRWSRYRFPPLSARVLSAVLAHYDPNTEKLCATLHPFLAGIDYAPQVNWLVGQALRWCGIPSHPMTHYKEEQAHFSMDAGALWIHLPDSPPLRPLAEIQAWVQVDASGWRLDAAGMRLAVEQGHNAVSVGHVLARLSGQALPPAIFERLATWEQQAHEWVLRPVWVLISPDAGQLSALRQNRHLRGLFEGQFSGHHAAVKPLHAAELVSRLARRGIHVTHATDKPKNLPQTDYLALAVRVYQKLSRWVELPVVIPGAVSDALGVADEIEQTARQIVESLAQVIAGKTALPAPILQDNPAAIRQAVEHAYHTRSAIEVVYWSPAYDTPQPRTLEPLTPLSQDNGAWYFDAWCGEVVRTFRLDRIVRLQGESSARVLRLDSSPPVA